MQQGLVGLLDQPHPKARNTGRQLHAGLLGTGWLHWDAQAGAVVEHGVLLIPSCVLRLCLQFSLIKRHYPHAVLGYSRKQDCLVTVRGAVLLCAGRSRRWSLLVARRCCQTSLTWQAGLAHRSVQAECPAWRPSSPHAAGLVRRLEALLRGAQGGG